jgi:purine-nucleoside phosphorylase
MYRSLGADTIGMSTGAEVIAARHMGMKVCVINAVSNMAAGMEEDGFDQDLIEENMTHSAENFKTLINGLLDSLSK